MMLIFNSTPVGRSTPSYACNYSILELCVHCCYCTNKQGAINPNEMKWTHSPRRRLVERMEVDGLTCGGDLFIVICRSYSLRSFMQRLLLLLRSPPLLFTRPECLTEAGKQSFFFRSIIIIIIYPVYQPSSTTHRAWTTEVPLCCMFD